jgi:UDP-N-acetylmuramate--alanine ligase
MEKVHFLGINGSGIVGVACLAKLGGFTVSGCDAVAIGNYSQQLKDLGIEVKVGHSSEHLENVDALVISAAILFNNKHEQISEVTDAIKKGIPLMKWQTFLDRNLVGARDFIAICGTHGKTSTTTITANLLGDLGYDPSVVIGGVNPRWNANFKHGNGKYFVCEADEYGGNFHAYHPKYIIFNNIEMEHPEYFKDYDAYSKNFIDFFGNIRENGALVFNYDDKNALNVILKSKSIFNNKNTKIIGFSSKITKSEYDFIQLNYYKPLQESNSFVFGGVEYAMKNMMGIHNVFNNMAALSLIGELKLQGDVKKCIENAILPKRRMEVVFENDKIKLYDDYAHHHTQIFYNVSAVKNSKAKGEKIISIVEPHLISRFSQNSDEYLDYMEMADYSIITKFYKSREDFLPDLDMDKYLINGRKTEYIEKFEEVAKKVWEIMHLPKNEGVKFNIIVMGAGNSYKLSEQIKSFYVKN